MVVSTIQENMPKNPQEELACPQYVKSATQRYYDVTVSFSGERILFELGGIHPGGLVQGIPILPEQKQYVKIVPTIMHPMLHSHGNY